MSEKENQYPKKTCTIDKLIAHPKLIQAALAGKKTEQRRNGIYAYPGETFELDNTNFEVTSLKQQSLGEMTDDDAQKEGYPNVEMYKNLIKQMHKGTNISFDDSSMVWVHTFKMI